MSLGARVRMRPVLYPAAILLAFVLNFFVDTGVSPYAAGRAVVLAAVVGLVVPWLAGLGTADRHRAGAIGVILVVMPVMLAVARQAPVVLVLALAALSIVVLQPLLRRRTAPAAPSTRDLWAIATRVLTAGSVIVLVAVGIKAVQLGRVEVVISDLVAESPLRGNAVSTERSSPAAPNMFFILLDGYPRADKLQSEFGIDNSAFIGDLLDRDFSVASESRSNQVLTHLTMAQMFNYESASDIASQLGDPDRLWRLDINNGVFFRDLHDLGYETVAVSPGFENVALRRADVFIDTGQLNEFEWATAELMGVSVIADAFFPNLAADLHRSRIVDAFRVAKRQARDLGSSRKFVFVHVVAPHSPQVFDADGRPLEVPGFTLPYGDEPEIDRFGFEEYRSRLDGQIAFIDDQTVSLVDSVIAADPAAVIVVFSDHGTGAPPRQPDGTYPYPDLRTANLLAVRSPGHERIVDDRSTLANLLPHLLRAYTGAGPADVDEAIYAWTGDISTSSFMRRPD